MAEAEFNASPVGRARQAFENGQKYFQTTFDLEQVGRNMWNVLTHSMDTRVTQSREPVGALLTAIENEDWQLIQSGFIWFDQYLIR